MARPRRRRPRATLTEPRTAERAYMRALRRLSISVNAEIMETLRPLISLWPNPESISREMILGFIAQARKNVGALLDRRSLTSLIGTTGHEVSRHSARDLGRVLAIDLRESIPGIQPMIDQWRDQNVSLIRSAVIGPAEGERKPLLDGISDVVEDAHAKGLRVEVLSEQLQERFDISKRRADLIARDQTLKLNGQINEHRQRAAGVTQYRWRAVGDERTRPMHMELDGTVHSWDSPPEVAPGRYEHPGGDYQCRCTAEPILPDWLNG